MKMRLGNRSTEAGFSLIELLVVIGIIALLIGILLPVMGKVRDSASAARCMSNLRQLAIATTGYSNDNNRFLPQPNQDGDITQQLGSVVSGESLWFNALDYHLQQSQLEYNSNNSQERNFNSFKQDPIWNKLPVTVNDGAVLDFDDVRTIKMNAFFGHGSGTRPTAFPSPGFRFFRVTSIPLSSQTVTYGDGRAHDTRAINTGEVDVINTRGFSMREILVGLRHEGGANLAKADASVAHETNPVTTGNGANRYEGWHDNDDEDVANRPESIFNFRPEDFSS